MNGDKKSRAINATSSLEAQSKPVLQLPGLMPIILGAAISVFPLYVLADVAPLPIRKLSVDNRRNIVVEYTPSPGLFPTKPSVQEFKGANHRVVLDFPGAVIDRTVMPSAASTLGELTKVFPDVRGIRYAALTGGTSPTARIVLDLSQSLQLAPHVVSIGENSVSIDLGVGEKEAPPTEAAEATPAQTPVAVSQPDTSPDTRIQPSQIAAESGEAPKADQQLASAPAATNPPPAKSEPATSEPAQPPAAAPESATAPAADASTSSLASSTTPAEASPLPGQTNSAASSALSLPEKAAEPNTRESGAVSEQTKSAAPVPSSETATAGSASSSSVGILSPDTTDGGSTTTQKATELSTSASESTAPTGAVPAPGEGSESTKSKETLTENPGTLESRKPANDAAPAKPDSESQATIAASAGKGYDPNVAREAAAAADLASEVNGSPSLNNPDAIASAALPDTAKTKGAVSTAIAEKNAAIRAEAEKHFKAAVKFHMAGDLPAAIAEYKATISINPNLAEPYCNLGLIYNQQHNFQAALDEFHKALAVNPKDAITYNGVGAALRAQKDLVGAIKNWQTAVKFDPKLATAHYNLGTAYEMEKEYDKALNAYKLAVTQDSHLGEAYYRMGLILQRKNDPAQALEEFSKSLKASTKAEYSADARQRIALLSKKVTR
jgi:tetratricopeptide (TPR) repeat protein